MVKVLMRLYCELSANEGNERRSKHLYGCSKIRLGIQQTEKE